MVQVIEEGVRHLHEEAIKVGEIIEGLGSNRDSGVATSYTLFMNLYTELHNLVTYKGNVAVAAVRVGARAVLVEYITRFLRPSIANKGGEELMKALSLSWFKYDLFADWLRRTVKALDDKVKRDRSRDIPTVTETAVSVFHEEFFLRSSHDVIDPLMMLIDKQRDGEVVDTKILRHIVEMFIVMGTVSNERSHLGFGRFYYFHEVSSAASQTVRTHHVHFLTCTEWLIDTGVFVMQQSVDGSGGVESYIREFEKPFLVSSGQYYLRKGSEWLSTFSTSEYLHKVPLLEFHSGSSSLTPSVHRQMMYFLKNLHVFHSICYHLLVQKLLRCCRRSF